MLKRPYVYCDEKCQRIGDEVYAIEYVLIRMKEGMKRIE